MPRFAVFFSDGDGAGIQFVQAMDRSHATDIMRTTHPEGPLCVMAADLVEGQDRHALLRSWLNRQQ